MFNQYPNRSGAFGRTVDTAAFDEGLRKHMLRVPGLARNAQKV